MSCIATITPASRTTTRGRLNIGSDAPIVGDCIAGLVEVGPKDGGRYPVAIDLNSKTCAGTSFPLGRAPRSTDGNRVQVGRKIFDQRYRFLNINPSFTI